MFRFLLAVTILLISYVASYGQQLQDEKTEVDFILSRFEKQENLNVLNGAMWTFIHDYSDANQVDSILKFFSGYMQAFAKYRAGDTKQLNDLGGVAPFKTKLVSMLNDPDQGMRAFSAVLIGITGDKTLAPKVAELLKPRDPTEANRPVYDRGRAAMSLGLLGASEYKLQIAQLLKSDESLIRSGGVSGLMLLNAKEFATEVAALLQKDDVLGENDTTPVDFLVETGTANAYKPLLVKAMLARFGMERANAAMYALVSINAKEHVKEIATLLNKEFRKGEAAKALALLGASQFTPQIAALLRDKNGLVRSAALYSLAILNARRQITYVAKLLQDTEDYVRIAAATSIIYLGAEKHYDAALRILEKTKGEGTKFTFSEEYPWTVQKQVQPYTDRLLKNIEEAKRRVGFIGLK